MKITIETIPHNEQRYDTCGDWQMTGTFRHGELHVTVSDLNNWRLEALIGIHELVEAMLCFPAGPTGAEVDNWDMGDKWKENGYPDPGEDPSAPYHKQHRVATVVESLVAAELRVDWRDYTRAIDDLT